MGRNAIRSPRQRERAPPMVIQCRAGGISLPDWRPAKLSRSRARPPRVWPFSPEPRSSRAPRHRAGQDRQCRARTPQQALTRRSRIGSLVGPCAQTRPASKDDQRPWSLSLWLETAALRVAVLRCSVPPRAGQVLGRDLNCSESCPGREYPLPRLRQPLSLRARPALGRPLRSSNSSWDEPDQSCFAFRSTLTSVSNRWTRRRSSPATSGPRSRAGRMSGLQSGWPRREQR